MSGVLGVRRYGATALLVEVADEHAASALALRARARGWARNDVVPAACTVLLDGVRDEDTVRRELSEWAPTPDELHPASGATITLPVTYDGADLSLVAEHWGVDVTEVVRRHTSLDFLSAFCGFAPGFAYLSGLTPEWAVPRLDTPRTRVPAGSVALADRWCGVYPTASPGGWLLLGRTDAQVWDLARASAPGGPALLAPGTRVRFEAA